MVTGVMCGLGTQSDWCGVISVCMALLRIVSSDLDLV